MEEGTRPECHFHGWDQRMRGDVGSSDVGSEGSSSATSDGSTSSSPDALTEEQHLKALDEVKQTRTRGVKLSFIGGTRIGGSVQEI